MGKVVLVHAIQGVTAAEEDAPELGLREDMGIVNQSGHSGEGML